MSIMEALQAIPSLRVIYSDGEKIFCSVRVTVMRIEKITSGSMMFDHARYYTFGQMVVFSDKDVDQDQGGALFFKAETAEEARDIVENITDYIAPEKEVPDNCSLIGE